MRNQSVNAWKAVISKVLVAVLLILSVAVLPTTTSKAASEPKLNKSSKNILVGKTYNLNVKNKIANSTYKWTTSNKKVATVSKKGVVKGIKAGSAVITCTVKAPKKTYELTCKVTVVKPATSFKINNKVTALNVGQTYNLNRTLSPSTSNDKTTWTSSDTTIAAPNKSGKFTALKEGTVTITGTTLSGKSDSVTIKVVDKDGTVTNQEELDALLNSGIGLITIKTDEAVNFNIKYGKYTKTKLVVDAPKADIKNYGVFSSVDILQIASNTWYENAKGNQINVLAKEARIVVGAAAKAKIKVATEDAKVKIENNGEIEELVIDKKANIEITGSSKKPVTVVANAANASITSSVPLDITCNAKIQLTLLAGEENTVIRVKSEADIPTILGDVKVKILVGEGDNVKETTVQGTPVNTSTGGNYSGGGSSGPATYSKLFNLDKPITEISALKVTYEGKSYFVSATTLEILLHMLNNEEQYIKLWKDADNTTKTYDGQTVTVTGDKGDATKTVTFTGGQLDGRSYKVTYNENGSVTIVSNTTNLSFNVKKYTDSSSLLISGDKTKVDSVSFTIIAGNTFYLEKSYKELKAIDVKYAGNTYSISGTTLTALKFFLENEATYLDVWNKITTPKEYNYDNQSFTVAGIEGSKAKTVTFGNGPLEGRAYTVTVNSDNSVTVVSNASGVSFTVSRGIDEKTLTISGSGSLESLDFDPVF